MYFAEFLPLFFLHNMIFFFKRMQVFSEYFLVIRQDLLFLNAIALRVALLIICKNE